VQSQHVGIFESSGGGAHLYRPLPRSSNVRAPVIAGFKLSRSMIAGKLSHF
jgi:hypothetical protein